MTPAEKKAFEKEFGTYWGLWEDYAELRGSHSQKEAFAAMRILQETGNMAKAFDSVRTASGMFAAQMKTTKKHEPDIVELQSWLCATDNADLKVVWDVTKYLSSPYKIWLFAWRRAGSPDIRHATKQTQAPCS